MIKSTKFLAMVLLSSITVLSCKKEGQDSIPDPVVIQTMTGSFSAQITPAFMGTNPMATGEHTVHITDLGKGQLRLKFDQFQAAPMPFEMTVDLVMSVTNGPSNSKLLEGKNGSFQAIPPNGGSIDPNTIPGGIQLPPGAEKGLSSDKATVSGVFAEIEKDGEKKWRYELKLSPGVPLPIEILIYSKNKLL